ncbi:MAG: hypothetical protein QXT19_04280 [Candidatus Woesearchaeota archaeon]
MISISGAVNSISAALDTIRKNRERRTGRITSAQFWERLVQINKQIKAAVDEEHAGPLRAQKALWFNYKILNDEISNISAVLNVVEQLIDERVLEEIQREGYDAGKTARLVEEGKKMLARIRSDVALHEDSLSKKISGVPITDDSLNRLEYRIAGALHGFEDSIQKELPEVIGRITKYPEYSGMSRRGFLSVFAKRAAAALILGTAAAINQQAYAQEAPKKPEITEEEIAELMKLPTVEDILKGANVEYVKYNPITKTTNYDELVFQRHLKPEERKPVLVFFYLNKDPPNVEIPGSAHRDAIIIKALAQEYSDKIKLVCYNADIDPSMAANNHQGFHRMQTIPSIVMFSPWDVVKGETPEKNDGTIKYIDTMRSGPKDNTWLKKWYKNIIKYWIPSNLTEPNKEFVWRSRNSKNADWTKIACRT